VTETVQFRIQLPVSLRDRFKTICARSNATMTDKVVGLIEREVDGVGKLQTSAAPKIASLNDDRLIARVVEAADRLGTTAASLGNGLGKTLDGFQERLLQAIPKPLTQSQITEFHKAAAAVQTKQNDATLAKVEKFHEQMLLRLDLNHSAVTGALAAKWTLWQAVGVGTAIGVGLAAALLWAISGTSPARSLAVSLTGKDSKWLAAQAIAGDGSPLHGAYMSETSALLKTPEFRESYARCVERAKTRKTSFNCTVRFPLLQEAK
jgi:hypothetical protein